MVAWLVAVAVAASLGLQLVATTTDGCDQVRAEGKQVRILAPACAKASAIQQAPLLPDLGTTLPPRVVTPPAVTLPPSTYTPPPVTLPPSTLPRRTEPAPPPTTLPQRTVTPPPTTESRSPVNPPEGTTAPNPPPDDPDDPLLPGF